MLFPRNILSK